MTISNETKKYIQLVERQEDVRQEIDAAFERATKMPILRSGKNRFWLISNPGQTDPNDEDKYMDTVSLVDAGAYGNIAIGSPDRAELNYELYPEADRQAAFRDVYDRWMNNSK